MRQPPDGTSARTPPGKRSAAGWNAPRRARQAGEAQANAERPPATVSRKARRPYVRSSELGGGNDQGGIGGGREPETDPAMIRRQIEVRPALAAPVDHEAADRGRVDPVLALRPEQEVIAAGAGHNTRHERYLDVRAIGAHESRAADGVSISSAENEATPVRGTRQEEDERNRDHRSDRGEEGDRAGAGESRARGAAVRRSCLPQQPIDAAEQEQLPLAGVAACDVREHLRIVVRAEEVGQALPCLLVGHGLSSPSRVASRLRPRRVQLFTVPSGTPKSLAISLCERSWWYASSSTVRSCRGRRSSADSSQKRSTSGPSSAPASTWSPIGSGMRWTRRLIATLRASVSSQAGGVPRSASKRLALRQTRANTSCEQSSASRSACARQTRSTARR